MRLWVRTLKKEAMEALIMELTAELVQRLRADVQAEFEAKEKSRQPALQPRLLTAKEAGEYIGRSEQAVRHLIHQRDIPVVRNGRCVRIDIKDLDRWINDNKV
jgi:excisionase family DNA binding protein